MCYFYFLKLSFFWFVWFLQKEDTTSTSEFDKKPTEDDFECIKLVSNGAYGWVWVSQMSLRAVYAERIEFGLEEAYLFS